MYIASYYEIYESFIFCSSTIFLNTILIVIAIISNLNSKLCTFHYFNESPNFGFPKLQIFPNQYYSEIVFGDFLFPTPHLIRCPSRIERVGHQSHTRILSKRQLRTPAPCNIKGCISKRAQLHLQFCNYNKQCESVKCSKCRTLDVSRIF